MEKLVNALKRFFGIGTGKTVKELDETLKTFLENFDRSAYVETVEAIAGEKVFERKVDAKETDNQGKEVKKTTLGERSDVDSSNSSSEGLLFHPSGRLRNSAYGGEIDGVKLRRIEEKTKVLLRKIRAYLNGEWDISNVKGVNEAVRVADKLGLRKSSSSNSYYGEYFEGDYGINGEIVRVRVSTHPANPLEITKERDGVNPDLKVSIVIRKNGEHKSDGTPHSGYEEIIYEPTEISPLDAANAVINGVKTLIETGEYVDITGKAHRTTYPTTTPNGEVLYSLKSLDAPYLDAVARGDMETAQRMVREAAAIAMPDTKVVDEDGLPKVVYHGGTFGQESYDEYNPYIWDGDGGAWFSTNEEYSNNYLKEDNTSPIKVFLDLRNIADLGDSNRFIIDDGKMTSAIEEIANKLGVGVEDIYNIIDWDYANKGAEFVNLQGKRIKLEESAEQYAINRTRGLVEMLEKAGYDGATNIEVDDVVTYMATSPNQIKSADVVTYDDAGNIIPLSERFNPEKEDIRYSLREATGEEVKEYLADALRAAYADRLEQIDKRYDYIADTAKTLY